MMKRQILVVENDRAICQSIQNRMQNEGIEVFFVSSVAEALKSMLKQEYCLVIISLQHTEVRDMEPLRMIIATFKKANNKQKRQTNAGNPTAKQNRVPYEPRQGAGPDFGPSIHEGGPSSWTTSSQWDSDRDCRAEGTELSSPFPPGPPGQPLHGESAYCPSQQCLQA